MPQSIFEFAPGASGSATPIKTISGAATGLVGIGGISIDATGNLYAIVLTPVTTTSGTVLQLSVSAFAPEATGNAAPLSSFTSASWTAPGFAQIGLD